MRNFKKVIAAGLALLMLALSVNVSFAAESYTDKEAVVVAKVNAAGIMTGTDKGFEPSKTLTRAEAAAIMVRMKGISEDTVKQNAGTTLFTDVAASHWAAGYVNVASNYGIIKGVGANKFAPEKEVTVAEFYTMAVRALNAGQLVEAEGTWPTNYVNFAIENKLAEDVAQIYTAASTRMTAATIVANTLTANMWTKDSVRTNGEITWRESDNTILYNTLNIVEIPNVEISNVKVKDLKADFEADAKVTFDKVEYDWTAVGTKDVTKNANISAAKAGMKYTVWYDKKEKEVVGFFIPTETTSIVFTEIKSFNASGDIKLVVDGTETKYKGSSCAVYVNGSDSADAAFATATTGTLATAKLPISGVAYYGTGADSDKIVKIYAENITGWGVVKETTDKKIKFEDASKAKGATITGQITIDLDKDSAYNYKVTKDGKEISIKDIEEGDCVFGYTNPDDSKDYTLFVYNDTVEGKVSSKSGSKITVNGKEYKIASGATIAAGNEGTFYLAENGKVVMFVAEKTTAEVAIVSGMRALNATTTDGDPIFQIKYTTMDGNLSDWTEVNQDDSDGEELEKLYDSGCNYDMVGSMIAYKLKGGKIIVKKNDVDGEESGTDKFFDTITAFKDRSNDEITLNSQAWYLADGVKVFEKVEYKTSADYDKYEVTLKEIEIDDLDDLSSLSSSSTVANKISYAADLDYKQSTAAILVLEKTNIKADKRYAVVIEDGDYSDDDDDTTYDSLLTVLYAGESKVDQFIYDDDVVTETFHKGDVVELSVDGNVLKRVTEQYVAGADSDYLTQVGSPLGLFLAKEYDNGTYSLGSYTPAAYTVTYIPSEDTQAVTGKTYYTDETGSTPTDFEAGSVYEQKITKSAANGSPVSGRYTIASDCIVVKVDGSDYKVSKFSDINLLDVDGIDKTVPTSADDAKRINDNNLNGAQSLVEFVTYYEDKVENALTSEAKIVAIVYNK